MFERFLRNLKFVYDFFYDNLYFLININNSIEITKGVEFFNRNY